MVRQHVNPLCSSFQKNIDLPDWNTEFTDISLPVHIDIGCAKGNYLIELASQNSHINYIGLEIRKPLVDQANKKVRDMKLGNITFIFCNANISFSSIYQSLYKVDSIYILNPDPWFKVRHKKRRLINEKFVEDLYKLLDNDIQIFIQTDVEDAISQAEMARVSVLHLGKARNASVCTICASCRESPSEVKGANKKSSQ